MPTQSNTILNDLVNYPQGGCFMLFFVCLNGLCFLSLSSCFLGRFIGLWNRRRNKQLGILFGFVG